LIDACKDHVKDTGYPGIIGHIGSDGTSGPDSRLNKYGSSSASAKEVMAYGRTSAMQVLLQLIVDDGVANRTNRYTILDPSLTKVGYYSGTHRTKSHQTCIIFAKDFTPTGAPDPDIPFQDSPAPAPGPAPGPGPARVLSSSQSPFTGNGRALFEPTLPTTPTRAYDPYIDSDVDWTTNYNASSETLFGAINGFRDLPTSILAVALPLDLGPYVNYTRSFIA